MLLMLAFSLGCAAHHGPVEHLSTEESLAWDLHPRVVHGDIRVAPAIVVATTPEANLDDILGMELDRWHDDGRRLRTAQLSQLPEAVHASVPGALFASMPETWIGTFRDARLPPTAMRGLERAVEGEGSLPEALAAAARFSGGDATLFTWVVELSGSPLTADHLVGEMLMVDGLPVVVDFANEPYQVEARVGVALVARDGEVLFRYEDDYCGLLSAHNPPRLLGQSMARAVVGDIAPMWLEAYDPRETPGVADLW